MPAIMTHDFFGKEAYQLADPYLGASIEERHAFLLGNQGPDPLFYLVLTRRMKPFYSLGSTMHQENPSAILKAFHESISILPDFEQDVARAYAFGFLCHYELDRNMHPLVYANQYAICNAGIEGISDDDGSEVHGEIEREFDEMVLTTITGKTIKTYKPYLEILHASDEVLLTIGKMYSYMAMKVFGQFPPQDMFLCAVKNFRRIQHLFYSPAGGKRSLAGLAETKALKRSYSFYRAMSHHDFPIQESVFANHQHDNWANPFTGEISTDSFWDIYQFTLEEAIQSIDLFARSDFSAADAKCITHSLNFSGEPTEDPIEGWQADVRGPRRLKIVEEANEKRKA